MYLISTVVCQMSTLYWGKGVVQKYILLAQMSIQYVECAITEIYLLLVARNLLKYILLLFIFLQSWHLTHYCGNKVHNLTQTFMWVKDNTILCSILLAQMSIQCVECAITEIYVLLVARNLLKYISLLFIFLVLRRIALLVASLVVASLSLVLF
jgi:hypothetical protein